MKKHLFLKSLLVAIGLLVTSLTSQVLATDRIVFMDPTSCDWESSSAISVILYWNHDNSGSKFTRDMIKVTDPGDSNNGLYYVFIPDWADRCKFQRLSGDGNRTFWNETAEQTINNWFGLANIKKGDQYYVSSWDNAIWWNTYTVYYDNSETSFANPKFRIGTTATAYGDDMTLVTGTKNLYKKTKTDADYSGYHAFCIANNVGFTGGTKDGEGVYNRGVSPYQITGQTEYMRGSLRGDFTIIGRSSGSYSGTGADASCTYYPAEFYYGVKKYTITCTSVDHATVELYYWDPSNTKQIVTEGNSAQVLPTTKVWCKVTPDAGYSVPKVMLTDGGDEREWTDASREDAGFEKNCYVVRHDVSFRAVIEQYATKTVLIEDVENFAPNIYFKGWNPFLYAGYDNEEYQITTLKLTDKVHICDRDYYVVTFTNEFPFFYIHTEGGTPRTAFFTYSSLTHMAKYSDADEGDSNWGLQTDDCGDAIYWVEVTDGSGDHYISNVVASTNDTLSFYVGEGSIVDFHSGAEAPVNQYSSKFSSFFGSGQALYGKAGAVFTAKTDGSGLTDVAIFDGDYHIHVNAKTRNYLNAGGVSKPGTTGTKFIRFDKSSLFGDTFDHYWVDWFLGSGDAGSYKEQSVVATVGNKYNSNLAGILGSDNFAPKGMTKAAGGNVRYGYDPETNHFERAIVASGDAAVQIQSNTADTDNDSIMVSSDGGGTYTQNATTARYFADATNWNYQVFAKVRGGSHATAKTSYVSGTQILANQKQLIGGEGGKQYVVVITYDFKTNRFIAAWLPEGDFEGFDLQSNLMVVRTEDGRPTVLNIVDKNSDGKVNPLTKITKMYTVLELLQNNWKSDAATYSDNPYAKRRIVSPGFVDEYYWISLPYECLVKDIFGIEGYGSGDYDSWVLQTYRGDLRAEKGWWAETNAWWYDMDRTDTLKANEGYVLRVTNLNGEGYGTKRFAGESGGKLYLYFPSEDNELTIAPLTGTVKTHLDSLKCTKWHKRPKTELDTTQGANNPIYDRRAIDSNWRIIGSPSFNSTKISKPTFNENEITDQNGNGIIDYEDYQIVWNKYLKDNPDSTVYSLKYFYNWEVESDGISRYETKFTIADAATTEFKATHAHLVQYAGDITWSPWDGDGDPATDDNPLVGIKTAPARYNDDAMPMEQTLRLVLKKDGNDADVTYISRMLFGATTGYDVNMDLSKMTNANSANIYTYGDLYKMAGNCLPDSVTTIQVGVQLAEAGSYTFSMPDGTYGTGVVLLDNVANTRTNLALTDYTVTLPEGETNERFYLELSPIAQTPTDIENVQGDNVQSTKVRKVMVDGVLYIVKDGKVYDAQGNRVK